ncbi:MAG: S8 family serine peptidase, partial [Planctomycetes bacterium]|nr:S8 family serine peptidase [Planctomycetota bacterium]
MKFKEPTAHSMTENNTKGNQIQQVQVVSDIDNISGQFRIHKISNVFKDFTVQEQRWEQLVQSDTAILNDEQKRLRQRIDRATSREEIAGLDRIFKLAFDLEANQNLQDALNAYRNNPNIEYAELNYVVSAHDIPNDAFFPYQWPLHNVGQDYPSSGLYNRPPGGFDDDIDALEAWDMHTGSSKIIYAVIDSGIDYGHRDLVNNLWFNSYEQNGVAGVDDDGNGYIDDLYGYDFINADANPRDDNGHGTHCAGIIAAEGNNTHDISGVCRDGQIMGLKFLGSDGYGSTTDAIEALYYAVNNGADILSNSWGGESYSESLREAINYAASRGVIFLASAGNDDTTEIQYPAGYDHVIAVAATNSDDNMAQFSNRGDWVDIAAPGVDILSLRATGTYFGLAVTLETTISSGTSMACPH